MLLYPVGVLFPLIQTAYWAALATWFGSAAFIALCVPAIHRVIRAADPTLPRILSVNLDAQHSTLLAGEVITALLRIVHRVGLVCGISLFVAIAAQLLVAAPQGQMRTTETVLRIILFVAACVAMLYDWRVVAPRVAEFRQKFIDNADDPDTANPLLEQYDRYQRESALALYLQVAALLGTILFSANIASGVTRFAIAS